MCFSRRLSTLVTLLSFSSVKQWSHCFNQLLSFLSISLSFYLSVSSSFHRAFQAHFIRHFKSISSWHRVFQAHQTFQAYFFLSNVIEADSLLIHVFQADSLSSDELSRWDQSLSFCSCLQRSHSQNLFRSCLLHSIELVFCSMTDSIKRSTIDLSL